MNKSSIVFIILLATLTSCGFLYSGTWEDEDENWERAYGVALPDSLTLTHSWYWRSPHFTMEYAFYFELKHSDALEELFLSYDDLVKLDSTDYNNIWSYHWRAPWGNAAIPMGSVY